MERPPELNKSTGRRMISKVKERVQEALRAKVTKHVLERLAVQVNECQSSSFLPTQSPECL